MSCFLLYNISPPCGISWLGVYLLFTFDQWICWLLYIKFNALLSYFYYTQAPLKLDVLLQPNTTNDWFFSAPRVLAFCLQMDKRKFWCFEIKLCHYIPEERSLLLTLLIFFHCSSVLGLIGLYLCFFVFCDNFLSNILCCLMIVRRCCGRSFRTVSFCVWYTQQLISHWFSVTQEK